MRWAALAGLLLFVAAAWFEREAFVLPADKEDLSLMIWGTSDEIQTVQEYVESFHRSHPRVFVKIQHTPDMGFRQKLNTRFKGGDPPDVFYLAYEDFPALANQGWVMPLDEVIKNDKTFDPGAFFGEVYEKFRWDDGKLYGVCKDFATLVVYYNRDLFDKYDVPYPRRGWTWNDFLDKARRLTHKDSREYGCVLETWPGEWFPWVWSAGGKLVETRDGKPRWVLSDPAYIDKNARAFQFLADLIYKDEVEPSPSVTRDQGTGDLFMTGKIGMCTYGRWKCMDFRHVKLFDWDVVEMPKDEREATTLFPVAYSIAKETRHKEAAWELVKFLTGKQAQVDVANAGHAIPSMRSVARSDDFFHARALAGLSVHSEPNVTSLEFAEPNPTLLTWQEVRETLRLGLEGLWNGSKRDAKAVLVALDEPIAKIVAKEDKLRRRGARE